MFRLGDWITSDLGVGKVSVIENGTYYIPAGDGGYFPAYNARLSTPKEITSAEQGRYYREY